MVEGWSDRTRGCPPSGKSGEETRGAERVPDGGDGAGASHDEQHRQRGEERTAAREEHLERYLRAPSTVTKEPIRVSPQQWAARAVTRRETDDDGPIASRTSIDFARPQRDAKRPRTFDHASATRTPRMQTQRDARERCIE